MSGAAIRQCGTVCEAAYFDQSHRVTLQAQRVTIDDADDDDLSPITDEQRRFAQRGQDHATLAMIMGPVSRSKLAAVAVTIRMGMPGDHLPYPRDFLVKKLRTFDEDEQDEAWELFGKGLHP